MFVVSVLCSDPACAEEVELWGEDIDAVLEWACECGCTWQVTAISEAALQESAS